jgi:uncharacterized membrane protein YbaN (DUF454 family)
MRKILLISGGTASLIMGIIGIFIPVLPTTPFMILSAGLYVKSSPALYNRIINSRLTSRYLTPVSGRRAGITALAIMWTMIILTAVFVVDATWLRILLLAVGATGTVFKIRYFFRKNNNQITGNH